eukprot:GHVN01097824.1.p1 GENE.GHVN01097824.1~~GHVN01097824.1.p1  ORF type:complete len:125 (-),score=20.26 GHVN01097824.1:268-642(-)
MARSRWVRQNRAGNFVHDEINYTPQRKAKPTEEKQTENLEKQTGWMEGLDVKAVQFKRRRTKSEKKEKIQARVVQILCNDLSLCVASWFLCVFCPSPQKRVLCLPACLWSGQQKGNYEEKREKI